MSTERSALQVNQFLFSLFRKRNEVLLAEVGWRTSLRELEQGQLALHLLLQALEELLLLSEQLHGRLANGLHLIRRVFCYFGLVDDPLVELLC